MAYWQALDANKKALAFGPVADRKAATASGSSLPDDDAEMESASRQQSDHPADVGFRFEALPMPRLMSPLVTE